MRRLWILLLLALTTGCASHVDTRIAKCARGAGIVLSYEGEWYWALTPRVDEGSIEIGWRW